MIVWDMFLAVALYSALTKKKKERKEKRGKRGGGKCGWGGGGGKEKKNRATFAVFNLPSGGQAQLTEL